MPVKTPVEIRHLGAGLHLEVRDPKIDVGVVEDSSGREFGVVVGNKYAERLVDRVLWKLPNE
jgi:hypothetical protein